jgi:pimeloyl-ACP methyl ester carboxylesterase
MKPIIHFAHGNGFPSPCYMQLLNHLNQDFACHYIEKVGHNKIFPVTENWHELSQEILQSIQNQANQPVIAIGHSLGGVLSFLAAIEQPHHFKCLILLDSPIIGRFKSHVLKLSKALGLIEHITPALRTKGRKRHWKSREEAWVYLKSKKLFSTFIDECLDDYIEYGLQEDGAGYSLCFDPRVEYQIYRTIPHILHEFEGRLKVPTTLIYGNKSNIIEARDVRYMKNKYHIASLRIKGSHMFPMERPQETVEAIKHVINKMHID